jgi:hypothetical protein
MIEKEWPNSKAIECVDYKDLYLVRVVWSDPGEQNYDPFFSVDPSTGEVNEFSIMSDGDPAEVLAAFQ